MGGVGQARSGLARVVVELHQTEDQVRGHHLKLIRRVCDDISVHMGKQHTFNHLLKGKSLSLYSIQIVYPSKKV